MPITVDVDRVRALMRELWKLETVPLEDITWVRKGVPIKVDPEKVRRHSILGLNNRDFVRCHLAEDDDKN
jgi:hypothetical protein